MTTKKYRDEYLFDFIKKSTDKKIILLFGEAHKWNLYPLLRKRWLYTKRRQSQHYKNIWR